MLTKLPVERGLAGIPGNKIFPVNVRLVLSVLLSEFYQGYEKRSINDHRSAESSAYQERLTHKWLINPSVLSSF